MKSVKKSIILLLVILSCSFRVYSSDVEYIHPFKLYAVNDSILMSSGALLSGSALVCDKLLKMKVTDFDCSALNQSDVPVFDQLFMQPYSKPLHYVGTGTLLVSLASPLIFATVPNNEWLTIGIMYAETLLISNGVKEWLKILVSRPRPYMYFDSYPLDKVEDGDWNCSFPSGHTTMAFAGAAFTAYLYNQYFPDSKWKFAVTGAAFGIAALTAGLRMASGNHFFTDVMTGAVIGTLCGFVVPYMHSEMFYKTFRKSKTETTVSSLPMGFSVQVKF